jgi:hypothetical protein
MAVVVIVECAQRNGLMVKGVIAQTQPFTKKDTKGPRRGRKKKERKKEQHTPNRIFFPLPSPCTKRKKGELYKTPSHKHDGTRDT